MASYRLVPISPADAARLRATGGPTFVADAHPGYPCRQCLRDAAIGEELVLVSYDPFQRDSPYRSASPIFLHTHDCGSPPADDELPPQLTGRQLSIRAFDTGAMMSDAAVIDGSDLADRLDRWFEDPAIDHVHVHNATRGCWAVAVRRVGSQDPVRSGA